MAAAPRPRRKRREILPSYETGTISREAAAEAARAVKKKRADGWSPRPADVYRDAPHLRPG